MAPDPASRNSTSDRSRQRKHPGSTARRPLLNMRQLVYFRNELKEIILNSEMEENLKASFMATLTARAEKISIPDAKQYIKEVQDRGQITPPTAMRVVRLLDRYTRYR